MGHLVQTVVKYFLLLAFTLFLGACSHQPNLPQVLKSPNDQRDYAYLTLDNALDVLVISDPGTSKAAASLDINIGSADDPEDMPGLAHFLEHMLFLGTEQYPEADEYQKFISEHGGSHNAYTSLEHTNYFFDIDADYLKPALDRFSQQFISPLFNEEYVEREVNAVHSEFSAKLKDDGRRYLSALKASLNPAHPYTKFSVGNLKTLRDSEQQKLRDRLLAFYDTEYSANRMKLTILGKEPLPALIKLAKERFSAVEDKALIESSVDVPYFLADSLPMKLEVQSIMDKRQMSLAFPMHSTIQYYQSQPSGYLANLLGHEGKGSLLSALKDAGLVDSLSAGSQFDTRNEAIFMISVSLTQKGLENQDQVIRLVFAYIDQLKANGIQKMYFDEQATMAKIAFQFQEKASPINYVRALSSALHETPAPEILFKGYDLSRFNSKLIEAYLNYLRPNNLFVTVQSKNVEGDRQTTWYNTPYKISKLDIDSILSEPSDHAENLQLPEENVFIPENTDFVSTSDQSKPSLIQAKAGLNVWHASNTEFGTPKSNVFLSIRSPYALSSVNNLALTTLMVSSLNDALTEFAYPAYLAGLNYNLYKHVRGITVKIQGYSDKQAMLLKTILTTLKTHKFDDARFLIIKERLKRSLENEKDRKPYEQAFSHTQDLLLNPSWSAEEKLAALEPLTLKDLNNFRQQFLSEMDTTLLTEGNLSAAQSRSIAGEIDAILLNKTKATQVNRATITALEGDQGWQSELEINHPDSGFVYYLQGKDKSFAERAKFLVLAQALGNDYYASLRTDKQLGYIVFATPFPLLEVPGLAFAIQSPSNTSEKLYQETLAFLAEQSETISLMDPATFERYKAAVVSRLSEKDNSLSARSNRHWSEIDRENPNFDTKEQVIKEVNAIQQSDFQSFYQALITNSGKSLVVYSEGVSSNETEPKTDKLPNLKIMDRNLLDSQNRLQLGRFAQ
jgi:secreted Zn-dependent insulinase-like peptidase